jgi:ADP-ribose pyrophosphatase YjhB (NUDIX family)
MSLDERVCHIPFIQTGSAIIIENENKEILLQERTDRNMWGLPGGCQDLGEQLEETAIREAKEETGLNLNKEDLVLIDTLSGNSRKNSYPNGDIVYNNTSLYLVKVLTKDTTNMKGDSETKRLKFFKPTELPENIMDKDLINSYLRYISK